MTPADLSDAVLAAVRAAVDSGDLTVPVPESVRIERPKVKEHGDYATNIALQLAKPAGRPPREVAEAIARQLRRGGRRGQGRRRRSRLPQHHSRLGRPGRARAHRRDRGGELRAYDDAWPGTGSTSSSSRRTRPARCTSGHVRWAAVGDALARVLEASGADVAREYYFNDAGVQIDRFAASLLAAAKGEPTPEDGYGGDVHRRHRDGRSSRGTPTCSASTTPRRWRSSAARAWS